MPSAMSSTFHLCRVSWTALHPHCHTSHSCHAFTVSTSAIQLFLFPEATLCPRLFTLCASHMPSVACSAIHLFFVFLEHLHTLFFSPVCRTGCHSSFLLFWGILALRLPTICTTIQKQLQPATLTIFPSRKFLHCSFSYQSAYLPSISYHLFFFISHFLCESFHWHDPSSLHTLYHHLLSHLTLCFPHSSLSIITHYPHLHYLFTY